MREFDFSVMTSVNDDAATVLDLGYLEYPGELLTDPTRPDPTHSNDFWPPSGARTP